MADRQSFEVVIEQLDETRFVGHCKILPELGRFEGETQGEVLDQIGEALAAHVVSQELRDHHAAL